MFRSRTAEPHPSQLTVQFLLYLPPTAKQKQRIHRYHYKSIPRIFLEYCDTLSGKVLIMGDFNIHFETLNDHNSRKMHDILEILSLTQSVTELTHKHGHLLDLVFHRHSEFLLRSTCLDHGLISDHIAVLCQLDNPKPAVQPVITQFRSISKIYKNSFKQDLAQSITPLTPCLLYTSPSPRDSLRSRMPSSA